MEHKLRVLVRLDLDPAVAVLEVTGCVAALNCRTLAPVTTQTAAMVGGQAITVDLTSATHIDPDAVTHLPELPCGFGRLDPGRVAANTGPCL